MVYFKKFMIFGEWGITMAPRGFKWKLNLDKASGLVSTHWLAYTRDEAVAGWTAHLY